MLENRYEYKRRVVPEEPISWVDFINRHQGTKIIGTSPSGTTEFRAIDLPKEIISINSKYQIFGETIQGLFSFLQTHNIPTPQDNLIDRLRVVNNDDYKVLNIVGRSDPRLGSLGVRLPNRLCIVNADAISQEANKHKVNFEDLLRMIGTHEIVHTLTYQESWVEIMNTPNGRFLVSEEKIFRRDGVYAGKPPIFTPLGSRPQLEQSQEATALGEMAEGTVQYITEGSLSPRQNESLRELSPYYEITESIKAIMSQIGEKPFIQATFTREGFRDLYKAIETRYGKGQFRTLLQIISNKSTQPLQERLHAQGFIL